MQQNAKGNTVPSPWGEGIIHLYMLLSYLMLVIYISVPILVLLTLWKGTNIDKKYDECILYFPRRVEFVCQVS